MRIRLEMALCLASVIIAGCSIGPGYPEQMVLYSIDGRDFPPGEGPQYESNEKFHGYPVLGKVEIEDVAKRKELMSALRKGIADNDGAAAKCFWPRHAIRAVENGKTIDYVVCFECLQIHIFQEETMTSELTTSEPRSIFNKTLEAADIPVIPWK